MGFVNGVNLLPSTGEFTYATTARQGQRVSETLLLPVNFYYGDIAPPTATLTGAPPVKTDDQVAIEQLKDPIIGAFPACQTVAIVCAWFGNSVNASLCQVYPSTTYLNNGTVINPATGLAWPPLPYSFTYWNGVAWTPDQWRCSSLNETSAGIIPISQDAFG